MSGSPEPRVFERKPDGRMILNIGRFRIASKFGRYRFGFHRCDGHLTMGLGLLWFNAMRRNRAVPR